MPIYESATPALASKDKDLVRISRHEPECLACRPRMLPNAFTSLPET
jgi:hypothetical protein